MLMIVTIFLFFLGGTSHHYSFLELFPQKKQKNKKQTSSFNNEILHSCSVKIVDGADKYSASETASLTHK